MFALFALTAGLLAAHDPRSKGYFRLFFEDPIHLKAGFASAAAALACFQVFSATWIFGKLPWRKPAWINPAHRWSGRLAFAFCGAMMAGIGLLLSRASRAKVVKEAEVRLAVPVTESDKSFI